MTLTLDQRDAVKALSLPAIMILGGSAFLALGIATGFVNVSIDRFYGSIDNVMYNSLCLGMVMCYATMPFRRGEALWVYSLGLAGEVYRFFWSHPASWSTFDRFGAVGFAAALCAICGMAWRFFNSRGDERLWARGMFLLSLVMLFFPHVSTWLHIVVIHHAPMVYDQFGYKVDGTFGFQPAAEAARIMRNGTVMPYIAFYTYNELPLLMITAVLLGLKNPESTYGHLTLHFMVIGTVGFLCYWLFPMIGINLFVGDANFPNGPLPLVTTPVPYHEAIGYARNCYPSLHLGWTLAVFLGVRRVDPRVRVFLFLYVCTMILSTLNVGHYGVDLVGSVPYVVAFFGAVNRQSGRNRLSRMVSFGLGGGLFAVWSALVFHAPVFASTHPAVTFSTVCLVVVGSLVLEDWLANSTVDVMEDRNAMPGVAELELV